MADQKISDLSSLTSLAAADLFVIVDASASETKKITKTNLKTTLSIEERWTLIDATHYTTTPASTTQLTMSDTTGIAVGLPLKYTISATVYYAVVVAVVANTSMDIAGASLGGDVSGLYVGRPEMVVVETWFVPSTYGDGAADLLDADNNEAYDWWYEAAYLVAFQVKHKTDDTTTEPKVNLKAGGNLISTNDSNNGVQVSTSWQENGLVNTTNYAVARGEAIEVACTVAGGTGDAADLSVAALFVLP